MIDLHHELPVQAGRFLAAAEIVFAQGIGLNLTTSQPHSVLYRKGERATCL